MKLEGGDFRRVAVLRHDIRKQLWPDSVGMVDVDLAGGEVDGHAFNAIDFRERFLEFVDTGRAGEAFRTEQG